MASNNFWTTPTYTPMQQFKFDVETNLWKANITSANSLRVIELKNPQRFAIPKQLIKALNLPDTSFSYDNDAANIGSGGPNIESQDPTISELELQLYLTGDMLSDMQDIFYTYYLQDIQTDALDNPIRGTVPVILNQDRISFKPSPILIKNSTITVNIYNSVEKIRSIRYYGVYPISYNLGSLDYSSPDVVIGSMKFYFYGYEIERPGEQSNAVSADILNSISSLSEKAKSMGDF